MQPQALDQLTSEIVSTNNISLEDTKIGYAYLSNLELKRAYALFKLVNNPTVSQLGTKALLLALKYKIPVQPIVKHTMFKQFCGGEKREDLLDLAKNLAKFDLKVICDFALEGQTNDASFDFVAQEVKSNIDFASTQPHLIPFVVFKMTGLMDHQLLEKVTKENEPKLLAENDDYQKAWKRIFTLCEHAYHKQVPLLIDAEESWINDGIDVIVKKLAMTFNHGKKVIIYKTLQLYFKDGVKKLYQLVSESKKESFKWGVKLVRGAYLEKEIAFAKELKQPIPVFEKKEDTDDSYNQGLSYALDNLEHVSLFLGTHNVASCQRTLDEMQAHGIDPKDPRIYFSQLYGMSDPLSFNLAHYGYNVAKYIPYGPIKEAIPYLVRRAQENTSVQGQSSRELSMIAKEMKRRRDASSQ